MPYGEGSSVWECQQLSCKDNQYQQGQPVLLGWDLRKNSLLQEHDIFSLLHHHYSLCSRSSSEDSGNPKIAQDTTTEYTIPSTTEPLHLAACFRCRRIKLILQGTDKSYKQAELSGAEAAFSFDPKLASFQMLFIPLRQANIFLFLSSQPLLTVIWMQDNF